MSIEIKDLSKVFVGTKKVLDKVSIKFEKNKITGLIGFNGSGKTTTFNILADFIEKYKGEILFDGKKPTRETITTISFLAAGAEPKNPMKVLKHLLSIASLYGTSKAKAMKIINPLAKKMDFTEFLDEPIRNLSKGNQQKIKVITALLNPNMKYLFLDEPFDGLDPVMVIKIKEIFMAIENVTIIITSHRMDIVQSMCYEFYVLKNGKMVASNKIDKDLVVIAVNAEVPITAIKSLPSVKEIIREGNEHLITIDNINSFKDVSRKLIASPKYKYLSLNEKSISESVFEGEF